MAASEPVRDEAPEFVRPRLDFDNGIGGFDPETGDYVIVLEDDQTTPTPWVNVMANPDFGCLVSEAGIGCSWALNSHENRITTWNNDPVTDGSGECLYLRDEDTGRFWSPTPLPVRSPLPLRDPPLGGQHELRAHGVRHRELGGLVRSRQRPASRGQAQACEPHRSTRARSR